jgi:hypothetical protein
MSDEAKTDAEREDERRPGLVVRRLGGPLGAAKTASRGDAFITFFAGAATERGMFDSAIRR